MKLSVVVKRRRSDNVADHIAYAIVHGGCDPGQFRSVSLKLTALMGIYGLTVPGAVIVCGVETARDEKLSLAQLTASAIITAKAIAPMTR